MGDRFFIVEQYSRKILLSAFEFKKNINLKKKEYLKIKWQLGNFLLIYSIKKNGYFC